GLPGDGPGGTASVVERWRSQNRSFEWINLATIREQAKVVRPTAARAPRSGTQVESAEETPGFVPEIVAIVFADVAGFGKMDEEQIPKFVHHFFGMASDLATKKPGLLTLETRGDGLYLAFSTLGDAAHCALELRDQVRDTHWGEKGLPPDLSVRISLHAGPAF